MDALSDPAVSTVVVMSSAQVGKPLAVDTPIATPSGWSTMGEIEPGDRVFGSDGHVINVTAVSPIYSDKRCFRIGFSDGSAITADAEHLWLVESDTPLVAGKSWAGAGAKVGTLTTEQIAKTFRYGRQGHRNRYAIPVAPALNLPEVSLPIDPYLLGAWLGDGHSASARLYCHESDAAHFASMVEAAGHRAEASACGACWTVRIDPKKPNICPRGHEKDVLGWFGRGCAECGRLMSANHARRSRGTAEKVVPPIVRTFVRRLKESGLLGAKHIPSEYLRASPAQRMALLQGLMDTDGHVTKCGRCEFSTTSREIADGVSELLASLGIKHTVSDKRTVTTYQGERVYGSAYRISFLAYADTPVFRLERKLCRLKPSDGGRPSETRRRRIVAVDPVESVPVRCIMVDAPNHLFLAGRAMIPTHNTECLLNVVGYHIDADPAPILVLQPILDMAQAWSKDRLAPMLRDSPSLRGRVADVRARDSGNTILHKTYTGGHITIAGANSAASLAARPIRIVLCDEVDRYPASAGTEGDPVTLARKRTTTFWNRKIALFSTPTIKGVSRIEAAFAESDRRRFWVPCPHCGTTQTLVWSGVKWDAGNAATARYACSECGVLWADVERWSALTKGEWRAEGDFNGIAGFHLSELYSPWVPLADTVRAFLDAKPHPEILKTWVNTALGETWEEQGETVDWHDLMARLEPWPDGPPDQVLVVTCGCDVQADRIEVERVGWGVGEESWSIEHRVIHGDPAGHAIWEELDDYLMTPTRLASGREVSVSAACIDAGGHWADSVHRFTREKSRRRVWAIRGVGGEGKPVWPKFASKSTAHKAAPFYSVGVDAAKDLVYGRLRIASAGPGYCHFPAGREPGYFEQLTSEIVVTKYRKGFPVREWEPKPNTRQEALDCRVYAFAALRSMLVNWGAFARAAAEWVPVEPEPQPAETPQIPSPPPQRDTWLGARRQNWLQR